MKINSFKDLDDKKIAILKSSVYLNGPAGINRYVKTFDLDIQFMEAEQYDDVFDLLNRGEVDAAVVSRISGLEAEKKYKNITATDVIFSPTELKFALTKGDADNQYLIEKLDYWVQQIKNDQEKTYEKLLQKHSLVPITQVEVIPSWVPPTVIGGVLFLLGSWVLILILRKARKIALNQLAEKNRYLGKIIDNVPIILSEVDKNGIIISAAGKSVKDIIDDPSELLGKSIFEFYKDNVGITEHIRIALNGQEVKYEATIDGRVFRVIATPVKVNNQVERVAVVAIDVTEEHKLEKAKKNSLPSFNTNFAHHQGA